MLLMSLQVLYQIENCDVFIYIIPFIFSEYISWVLCFMVIIYQ